MAFEPQCIPRGASPASCGTGSRTGRVQPIPIPVRIQWNRNAGNGHVTSDLPAGRSAGGDRDPRRDKDGTVGVE